MNLQEEEKMSFFGMSLVIISAALAIGTHGFYSVLGISGFILIIISIVMMNYIYLKQLGSQNKTVSSEKDLQIQNKDTLKGT